jgi:hypothetical protein
MGRFTTSSSAGSPSSSASRESDVSDRELMEQRFDELERKIDALALER